MASRHAKRRVVSPAGFDVVGSEMVAFTLLGLGIDYLAGSMPWATVIFTILGLVAAMAHLIRMANSATAQKSDADSGAGGS